MKKLLIISTLIFCSFFIIDKVGATSVTAYYDSEYVQDNLIANADIDYLNNELIPFINRNLQNYFVVLQLYDLSSDIATGGDIYIMPRNTENNGAVFMYVQNGYRSHMDFFPYTTIDNDYVVSGRVRNYYHIGFNTSTHNTIEATPTNIISSLTSWLNSPTYTSTNFLDMFSMPSCNTSSCNIEFLNTNTTLYGTLPYYMNYPSILATTLAYQDYQGDYIVNFDNEQYTYSLGEVFPTYSRFINENFTTRPEFIDFGNNSYGFVANEIEIADDSSSGTVNCPENTDFINDYCYTNVFNYSTDDDLDSASPIITFFLDNKVEYIQDHYYIFTYRFDSDTLYLPTLASASSGLLSTPMSIERTNVINSGLYRDVQLVLKANNTLGTDSAFTFIGFKFPSLGFLNPDYQNWHFGIFRNFTITDFGTSLPSVNDLNTDYNTNNITGITSSDTSWFNNFNINDRGLSSFVTAPIRLFQRMRTTTCSSVILPLPYFGNIELPCIKSIFEQNLPTLLSLYQVIISGIICYYVGLNYFRIIKNAFNPEDDRIEVQDL